MLRRRVVQAQQKTAVLFVLSMCTACYSQVQKLIAGEPALLARYTNSLLESYIDDNKRAKW